MRDLWKQRLDRRAVALVVVVLHDDRVTLCGATGDDPRIYRDVDADQAERICAEALKQPDRHAALRCLRDALPAVESPLPGLRNEGFLATHELQVGGPRHPKWAEAGTRARAALNQSGPDLLKALGFHMETLDQATSILRVGAKGQRVAVAVLLHPAESPELEGERFNYMSPVSYALDCARRENLPYVAVVQERRLRLYPARLGVGVGRRGPTETYLAVDTNLLSKEQAAYLWLLFSGEALAADGTLEFFLEESKRFAARLAANTPW